MNAAKNKRAIIVGMFIFLGLAILIIGILTLGGQNKTFVRKIQVRTVFDDVSGLQPGNNVWFSGVKIGTVKRMGFHGSSQVEVLMNIEEKAQPYIRKNSKAKISTDGLIGNKIIVIYGGTPQVAAIENGDNLGIEKAISTDDMMTTFQENNQNLLAITNDFKAISRKLTSGQGSVGKLLNDEALINNLEATLSSLKKASVNTERITSSLYNYTAQLHKKGGLANDFVTDTTVFNNIRATVKQLNDVAATAGVLTNNLKDVSTEFINNKTSTIGVLMHDEQMAAGIKTTISNLSTSSQKLDENMEALQHNFLLRGFFRRKAKKEQAAKEQAAGNVK